MSIQETCGAVCFVFLDAYNPTHEWLEVTFRLSHDLSGRELSEVAVPFSLLEVLTRLLLLQKKKMLYEIVTVIERMVMFFCCYYKLVENMCLVSHRVHRLCLKP